MITTSPAPPAQIHPQGIRDILKLRSVESIGSYFSGLFSPTLAFEVWAP